MLAVTSGTTGKSCLIPKTHDNSKAFVEYGFAVGVYYTMFNVLPQVRDRWVTRRLCFSKDVIRMFVCFIGLIT